MSPGFVCKAVSCIESFNGRIVSLENTHYARANLDIWQNALYKERVSVPGGAESLHP